MDTGKGGIWLIMPGMSLMLQVSEKRNIFTKKKKKAALNDKTKWEQMASITN